MLVHYFYYHLGSGLLWMLPVSAVRSSPAAPRRSVVASPRLLGSGRVRALPGLGILGSTARGACGMCPGTRPGCGWSALLSASRHPRDLLDGLDLQHRVQAAWPGAPAPHSLYRCSSSPPPALSSPQPPVSEPPPVKGTASVCGPCAVSRGLPASLLRWCRTLAAGTPCHC